MQKTALLAKLVVGTLVLAGPIMAQTAAKAVPAAAAASTKPVYGVFGIDLAGLDLKAAPGDDLSAIRDGVTASRPPGGSGPARRIPGAEEPPGGDDGIAK